MQKLLTTYLLIGILVMCPISHANMDEARRLLNLIDTIQQTDCEVIYNGSYFDCKFVAKFARAFLVTRYRGETAEQWIDKWCSHSHSGETIWVKENKKYEVAIKRLREELKKQHG